MTRRPHWVGELLVVVSLLFVYDYVSGLAKVRAEAAYDHGRLLLGLSPWGIEHVADLWLSGIGWLHDPAAYYYDLAHIDVTMAVLVGCYVWRAEVFRRARTALVLINLLGLAVFLLYPAAPPRLLPGAGFVDIVADSGTWGSWETAGGGVAEHTNSFGAMPSLHAAWAVWVALTVMTMTRDRRWRALGWAHVAMTLVVVISTGNHYLVDVVAGGATAATAWALAPRFAFRRVEAPAFAALAD